MPRRLDWSARAITRRLVLRSVTDFRQEAANSDFLLEHGAAAKANRVEDLPYRVEQLLGSKKLGEMGKVAKSLGRANAAQAICREVLSRAAVSNKAK
jgi:UDP-N-acetylglucosamine:LPS N-acetylglucosamine transferase